MRRATLATQVSEEPPLLLETECKESVARKPDNPTTFRKIIQTCSNHRVVPVSHHIFLHSCSPSLMGDSVSAATVASRMGKLITRREIHLTSSQPAVEPTASHWSTPRSASDTATAGLWRCSSPQFRRPRLSIIVAWVWSYDGSPLSLSSHHFSKALCATLLPPGLRTLTSLFISTNLFRNLEPPVDGLTHCVPIFVHKRWFPSIVHHIGGVDESAQTLQPLPFEASIHLLPSRMVASGKIALLRLDLTTSIASEAISSSPSFTASQLPTSHLCFSRTTSASHHCPTRPNAPCGVHDLFTAAELRRFASGHTHHTHSSANAVGLPRRSFCPGVKSLNDTAVMPQFGCLAQSTQAPSSSTLQPAFRT